MVEVSTRGTKISITGGDPAVLGALQQSIGTASYTEGVIRCRLSIPNFRRIRRVCPQARLSKDTETRAAVQALKHKERLWLQENKALHSAKAGRGTSAGYPFCFTPYEHQRKGFAFMHAAPRSALFGDCGIGKTAIVAAFLDSLRLNDELDCDRPALIVCPISIIKQAWLNDIAKFTTGLLAISVYEPSSYKRKEKRLMHLKEPADAYIVSFSLLRILEKELRAMRFRTIIIDESTKIKNPQSQTFRSLREIAWKADRRYILSGTPAPNGPLDLWSQFSFVDEGMTLEPSLVDFRHEHFHQIGIGNGQAIWRPKAGMTSVIYNRIEPRSIRFKASECLDLPDQTFAIRELEMSSAQRQAYSTMAEHMFLELDDGDQVTARIPVSRLMKLREITGGFVINDDGEPKSIAGNAKAKELDDLLEEMLSEGNKAIIWIQYQWEAAMLLDKYRKRYGAVDLYGATPPTKRDANVEAFLSNPDTQILVAHPQSAAHGLTLTSANYAIYYSLSHNFEDYYQSSKRIHRPGQHKPCFYYFLIARNSIDMALLQCIQDKKNVQDLLIDGALDSASLLGIRKKT